uniref:Glycerate kinase n=1 Tax=Lutzomyia longipalpis TaxID=7200 RepID=A0A7G3ANT5_LUTLO
METVLKNIFLQSVESVRMKNLFQNQKCLQVNHTSGRLIVEINAGRCTTPHRVDITGKRCHLVGFGKAVYGMAAEVEAILGTHLVSGILSVPCGTVEKFKGTVQLNGRLEVCEGAKNNLPDDEALGTAIRVKEFASRLSNDDVLFVLISGGGSALLPLPAAPVSLEEKMQIIRMLVKCGATINELNTVRIAISSIKGGKLATTARKAHQIISLVISDIVGDPVDLIASGPTHVSNINYQKAANEIIDQYKLRGKLPKSVEEVLNRKFKDEEEIRMPNNHISIIANNSIAVEAALLDAKKADLHAICLSRTIEGDVEKLSEIYLQLLLAIKDYLHIDPNEENKNLLRKKCETILKDLKYDGDFINNLIEALKEKTKRGLCIVAGGETTVEIKGKGLGGRNQELTLHVLRKLLNHDECHELGEVAFLSAGTDGIDGPTSAAGAVGTLSGLKGCSTKCTLEDFLSTNNSYAFWRDFYPRGHIVTGHTGTNVMDIHILFLPFS